MEEVKGGGFERDFGGREWFWKREWDGVLGKVFRLFWKKSFRKMVIGLMVIGLMGLRIRENGFLFSEVSSCEGRTRYLWILVKFDNTVCD